MRSKKMIEKLGIVAALSERDRIAIAFAIRCAYALGKLDNEGAAAALSGRVR